MRTLEEWLELEKIAAGKSPRELAATIGCGLSNAVSMLRRIASRDYPPPGVPRLHRSKGNTYGVKSKVSNGTLSVERYRPILEAGAADTLEAVAKRIGVTRERVRQLYIDLRIPRHRLYGLEALAKRVPLEVLIPYTDGQHTQREACKALNCDANRLLAVAEYHGIKLLFRWEMNRMLQADGLRRCCVCMELKPLTDFYPDKRQGHDRRCRLCVKIEVRRWYVAHRHTISVLRVGRLYLHYAYGWTPNLVEARLFTTCQRANTRITQLPVGAAWECVTDRIHNLLTPDEILKRLTRDGRPPTLRAIECSRAGALQADGTGPRQAPVSPSHS